MQIWVENAALRKYILRFGVNFRSLHGRNVKKFSNLGLKKWIIVFLTFRPLSGLKMSYVTKTRQSQENN